MPPPLSSTLLIKPVCEKYINLLKLHSLLKVNSIFLEQYLDNIGKQLQSLTTYVPSIHSPHQINPSSSLTCVPSTHSPHQINPSSSTTYVPSIHSPHQIHPVEKSIFFYIITQIFYLVIYHVLICIKCLAEDFISMILLTSNPLCLN